MIYEFMSDDGEVIEASFPMSNAPKLGSVHTVTNSEGKQVKATRIMSTPHVQGDNWKPYISNRLPRNIEGVKCTPAGKPIIETRQQERNIASKLGYERE